MVKILITGITGLLGTELHDIFTSSDGNYEVYGLSRHCPDFLDEKKHIKADISNFNDIFPKITKTNPDIIINTAALSNVDECERNPDDAYRINTLGARNLSITSRKFDSYLIHISTDYIFGGKPPEEKEGYLEYEEPSPINQYGKSKLWGEYALRDSGASFTIIRTSWLFGSGRENYITQFANSKSAIAATDMVSSPTYVSDLANAIKKLIDTTFSPNTRQCDFIKNGIYHITNQGYASRYEIALFVAKTLQLSKTSVKKTKVSELKMLTAKRPTFSALKSTLWHLEGFDNLRNWQDAVKEFLSKKQR